MPGVVGTRRSFVGCDATAMTPQCRGLPCGFLCDGKSLHPLMKLSTSLGRLRFVGFAEGVSFLVLVGIAMPLKYFAGEPIYVRVVGMTHGVLFLGYVLALVQAHTEYCWPLKRSFVLFIASLLPFGPFVTERKVLRGLPE